MRYGNVANNFCFFEIYSAQKQEGEITVGAEERRRAVPMTSER